MKQMKTFIKRALPAVILVLLFAGCQKTEFMPPPEGEKITYNPNVTKDINKVLSESPYKLFYTAWQRSTIDDKQLDNKTQYTLLVPTDAAMQSAGYTADAISKMAVNDVDSLVAFYTINYKVTKADLLLRTSNYEGVTLHTRADIVTRDGPANYSATYYYRQYLGIDNSKLLVNGVTLGSADAGIEATNGYVWPIDKTLQVPNKSFLQVLEGDPRFSIFLELQRRSDIEHNLTYNQLYLENFGFEPGDDYRRQYYLSDKSITTGSVVLFSMMFAPTNDAFKAAGFNSVEELLTWNKRAKPMEFDWNAYDATDAGFPSDTILAYHWDFGRANQPYTNQGKAPGPKPTTFYPNDLRNDVLGNYLINFDPSYVTYLMPYTFSKNNNGQVQMQIKGSTAAAATVTETINTLMGPLYVVDRLLIPKDFKLK